MKNTVKSSLLALALTALVSVSTSNAMAFDLRSTQAALQAQASAGQRLAVPASYRIMQDDTRQAPAMDGSGGYYGGKLRTLLIDGRAVRMSEREIIENIRAGRFVPVYTETGSRLSRDDWASSLPQWIVHATLDYAD